MESPRPKQSPGIKPAPFAFPRQAGLIVSGSQMPTEAETCRKFTVPALQRAGREDEPHAIGDRSSS
jgi:hypothetical protein